MEKADFERVFDSEVARPLIAAGFVPEGKSLHLIRDNVHVALIRLGGKKAIPGSIASILCVRHSYLRLVQPESDAASLNFSVTDFPFKLSQKDLTNWKGKLRYQSRLLGFDYDRLNFSGLDETGVTTRLAVTREFLLKEFVPVALAKGAAEVRSEILKHGQDGWCERLWIEDYDAHLRQTGGTS